VTGELPPIREGLFRIDEGGPVLTGGWSPSAGLPHFPLSPLCPFTGAEDIVALDLPRVGQLWLWTQVTSPPPGYTGDVPYGVGIVELHDPTWHRGPLRVLSRLSPSDPASWTEGDPVRLIIEAVPGPDGEPVATWAFTREDR